ncbi:MAG: alpha/beta fold hydrolase [Thermaerobacter sp.]|nr:alpha/beta fold hydrolase [Thermaerobacter sp.]
MRFLDRPHEPDLFLRIAEPPIVRARLLFIHASLVHSEYYVPIAAEFARHGIETWLPDLRGHGWSGGTRGHTRDWHEPIDDVVFVWRAMKATGPKPMSLIGGESYGALLSYWAVRAHGLDPDGALFLSPAFGLNFHVSELTGWLLTHLAWPIAGRVRPPLRLPVEGVTEDPAIRRIFERDPSCKRRYTLGFLLHLLATQDRVPKPDTDWRTKTLSLLSAHDPITNNDVSRAVFGENPEVTWRVSETGLHSIVADRPDWVVGQFVAWLRQWAPLFLA